jgi:tetratricopeptide (TPR) repeat protein
LHNLGNIAQSQGDFTQAEAHFQTGLALAEEFTVREMICVTETSLGEVAFEQEQFTKAGQHFQHALVMARENCDKLRTGEICQIEKKE